MQLLIITQKVDLADPVLGFFHRWIEEFAKHFEKVNVITLEAREYSFLSNVEVYSLGKEKKLSTLRQFLNLQSAICNLQYDFVFVHMNPEYLVLFGWYWKLMRKRTALWYTHKSVTWWLRLAEKFVDKIFTASAESFRLPSKKVEIAGHGIDLNIFRVSDVPRLVDPVTQNRFQNDGYTLLSVGRITPSKDIETIIRAVKRLRDQGIAVILDVVGAPAQAADMSYTQNLKELVEALTLQNEVKFLGSKQHDELPEIYKSHDVLVHTSKTGSIDKVVLESLACGTPVLSSSEAFQKFLPENFRFRENDAIDLGNKIEACFEDRPDMIELVAKVRRENNLDNLIEKIALYFKA